MFTVEGKSMTAENFAFKFSKLGKHLQGTVE